MAQKIGLSESKATPMIDKTLKNFINELSARISHIKPESQEIILDLTTRAKKGLNDSTADLFRGNAQARLSLKEPGTKKYLKTHIDDVMPSRKAADDIVRKAEMLLTAFHK